MEANLEPKSDVLSAPILIDSDEPNQLVQSAYHEAGHVVADVGLLGELCYDVRAFAQPTLTYDRRNRPMTVMGLCQTSFGNQPAEWTVQGLIQFPEGGPSAFARAVNRVFSAAAGPFAQAELLGDGELFDEVCFPDGGDGDLEHAHDALLPFFADEVERWGVLGRIWCSTRKIMRQPKVWAAVEDVAVELVALAGREPLDGDIVHDIIGHHLHEKRLRVTPIVRVKWSGVVNASILDVQRIAPSAIPIISLKDDNEGDDVESELIGLAADDGSCLQTETLSDLHKYVRPDGRTWRTDVSQLLKLHDVEERVCLKRAKIYALIETGDFPPPVKLTPGRSVWLADEVTAWVQRKAEASRKTAGGGDDQ